MTPLSPTPSTRILVVDIPLETGALSVGLAADRVIEVAAYHADELEACGPPADFHAVVAFPLPALVVCELLGIPAEDRPDFCRWQIEAKQVSKPAVARGGHEFVYRSGNGHRLVPPQ